MKTISPLLTCLLSLSLIFSNVLSPKILRGQDTLSIQKFLNTPEMHYIEGGTFTMGSKNGYENEKPAHKVQISSFHLAETETTNEQFCYFLNEMGKQKKEIATWLEIDSEYCQIEAKNGKFQAKAGMARHPVVKVSWYGAIAFCEWLSQKTGFNYRLPTESEWEYAAGGGKGQRLTFAGTNDESSLEKYAIFRQKGTAIVKSKSPLKIGSKPFYDLSGNVWEWCSDWYEKDYYQTSPSRNPKGPVLGSRRVIRGGGWRSYPARCQVVSRNKYDPSTWNYLVGFRLARTP
ncbi:MAG: formylglycine-generating enzyme family protein [Bacteroidia bacterium]|nr:formylglycine-generating enzyme family protein [Bacteroidia bacterium]